MRKNGHWSLRYKIRWPPETIGSYNFGWIFNPAEEGEPMVVKQVLVAERVRSIPPQFSWVDQRLVREGYFKRCDTASMALYLFLVTVTDAQGLSYYADRTLQGSLLLDAQALSAARGRLMRAGLIAYRAPIYQVLSLDAPTPPRGSGLRPLTISLHAFQARYRRGAGHHAAAA